MRPIKKIDIYFAISSIGGMHQTETLRTRFSWIDLGYSLDTKLTRLGSNQLQRETGAPEFAEGKWQKNARQNEIHDSWAKLWVEFFFLDIWYSWRGCAGCIWSCIYSMLRGPLISLVSAWSIQVWTVISYPFQINISVESSPARENVR